MRDNKLENGSLSNVKTVMIQGVAGGLENPRSIRTNTPSDL
jgi:hypothetical protein